MAPYGFACQAILDYTWPEDSSCLGQLGSVLCKVRTKGGILDFDVTSQWILLESLVLACDWVLARHSSGLTIRGCPVPEGFGSPLAVAVKTPASRIFMAGSVMELELKNSGDYKRGKEKISVLIVGYYCSKKKAHEEGAGFQVSPLITLSVANVLLDLATGGVACRLAQTVSMAR